MRGTPLYGLNGDVQPNRVSFSNGFVLNRVLIASIFVSNTGYSYMTLGIR